MSSGLFDCRSMLIKFQVVLLSVNECCAVLGGVGKYLASAERGGGRLCDDGG